MITLDLFADYRSKGYEITVEEGMIGTDSSSFDGYRVTIHSVNAPPRQFKTSRKDNLKEQIDQHIKLWTN